MIIQRAYKTKIRLNNEQEAYFYGNAGVSRFVYNWCLEKKIAVLRDENGKIPSARALKKQFNALKHQAFPWLDQYPYQIVQEAFEDCELAFKNYWRKRKEGEVARSVAKLKSPGKWEVHVARMLRRGYQGIEIDPHFPRFKSRARSKKSFRFVEGVTVEERRIRLPRIGWVILEERGYLPVGCSINSATVSCVAEDWYVSVQVEEEIPDLTPAGEPLGVDFGIKALATVSNGTVFENPKALAKSSKRLNKLYRQASRQQKGSKNQEKTYDQIAKLQHKVAGIRRNALHQVSAHVTHQEQPRSVVIEDLNVAGMLQNSKLARAISDVSFSEMRRQIEYKAKWDGIEVILADRWLASSKTCSGCGHVKTELSLSERTYRCEQCGMVLDRDLNAAVNLSRLSNELVEHEGLPVELSARNEAP